MKYKTHEKLFISMVGSFLIMLFALFGCVITHATTYAAAAEGYINGVYYSYNSSENYVDAMVCDASNRYDNLVVKSKYNGTPVRDLRNSFSDWGYDCKTVIIESGIESICQDVFHDWKNLEWVQIPVSVETICKKSITQAREYIPFEGCTSLKYIYYEGTREDWEKIDRPGYSIENSSEFTLIYLGDNDIPNTVEGYELQDSGEKKLSNRGITRFDVKVKYGGWQPRMYYSVGADTYPASANERVPDDDEFVFQAEGYYLIEVRNDYAQAKTYRFRIDKTPPEATFSTTQSGGFRKDNYTNGVVSATWTETGLKTRIQNLDEGWESYYSKDQQVSAEGSYVITISDSVGNETRFEFCIDKTPPSGTLMGVSNSNYTNNDVQFWIPLVSYTATLDGEPYANMSYISEEGNHEIVLTDQAGNETVYKFCIDKTPPEIELKTTQSSGFHNGYYTNGDVTVSDFDLHTCAKYLNGQYNTSVKTLTEEGCYVYEVDDYAGNKTIVTFTIDRTRPEGTLETTQIDGFRAGNYTNGDVTFSWDDPEATAKISAGANARYITAEGSYTIVLTDLADNSNSYSFVIDKTKPVISLSTTQSSGFHNGYYTNGDVTMKDDNDAGGSGIESRTVNSQSCGRNTTITAEGRYTFIISDMAGNTVSETFTIDRGKPEGTLETTQSGGFHAGNYTNGDVKFKWDDPEATAKLNAGTYVNARKIITEGIYTLVLTDFADNSKSYSFIIDKTKPEITVNVGKGAHTNGDVTVSFSDTAPVTGTYGRSESLTTPTPNASFSSGRKFGDEGNYNFSIVDAAGNSVSYDFIIDKTAPIVDTFDKYINTAFTMSATDKYGSVAAWEYRFNSGSSQRVNAATVTLGGSVAANGVWEARVMDELGNTSRWETIYYAQRDKFGNSDGIFNSYASPAYYVVSLSQKNYVSCFGSYTFSQFEFALHYATQKEWECRVIELDGGRSWNYVSPTNENVRQIYADREELDAVIDKYARRNVSERRVIGQNGSVLNNPTNADGVTCEDALTCQLRDLPPLLKNNKEYANFRGMIAYIGYSLTTPKSIVEGNKSSAYIRYLSDGISIREGDEQELNYGVQLKNVIKDQGWYLIRERDVCGNEECYLVYIDLQQPDLYANVTYGSGSGEEICFSQDFIDRNKATMRYVSFELQSLSDNIDEFTMLSISGKNLNEQYVWGDDLPVLSYENGYSGAYEITGYDRSRNVLSFTVYIAGEAPSVRHSSLTNDVSCTFTVQLNDSYNEITDIKFYKIHYNGDEERIYADSMDTPVSAENLTYKMTVGGKYVFVLTDLYGRIVRTSPYFYMKGLPTATFKGVKDGGLTKNDVTITYETNISAVLSIWIDGQWEEASNFEIYQGVSSNSIRITAGAETTGEYHVLLYVTEDRNLFSEYAFEIDGIPPIVSIVTEGGDTVMPETVTTQNFYVTWQESGYKAYYKKQGAISDMQYVRESLITTAGTYVFTFYDEARNELTFAVTLDNSVSYTLEGSYTLLEDGSYLTRGNFVFTLNEPWSVFEVESSNGIAVTNGQKLDTDGTYRIHAVDMFGNEMSLVLIIDKLPPVAVITSASGIVLGDGARTKEAFCVSCDEDNVAITYAFRNGTFAAYDGSVIDTVGLHNFRLTDRVGNVATVSITIDREVEYSVDGSYIQSEGILYSKSWLKVEALESILVFSITSEDGSVLKNTDKVSSEGRYQVKIIDLAGNTVEFEFEIDKTPPKLELTTESGVALQNGARTFEAVTIVCEESDATLTYSTNGAKPVAYKGELVNDVGTYEFSASDKLGNASTVTVVIDREVAYSVDGSYTELDGIIYSKSWVQFVVREETITFSIIDAEGNAYDNARRINTEGQYAVSIMDLAGNRVEATIVIDKTAPEIHAETKSGRTLNGGSVNEAFRVACGEKGAVITFTYADGKSEVYDGAWYDKEGRYTFTVSDWLNNTASITVIVNYGVAYEVNGTYVYRDEVYYSSNWLQVSPLESTSLFAIADEEGNYLDNTKKIYKEGTYIVNIVDLAGNAEVVKLVIDKTAPKFNIVTEGGKALTTGSTTNESFKIECAEEDSALQFSYNRGNQLDYYGEWLTEAGRYVFTVTDFLGNSVEIEVSVDKSVSLNVNGTYVKDGVDTYLSMSWLSVTLNEEMTVFSIDAPNSAEYWEGVRISEEGEYKIYARDLYGNELTLYIVIDKTAPQITLAGVANGSATNEPVVVEIDDFTAAQYRYNNGDKLAVYSDTKFEKEGEYIIYAQDLVGNTATAKFTIDKHVDVLPSVGIVSGQVMTSTVSFQFGETVTAILSKNGNESEYSRGVIANAGDYVLTATDAVGNIKIYSWTIVPVKAREYRLPLPEGVAVSVEKDGLIVDVAAEDGVLALVESGKYYLRFTSENAIWELEVEVDNIAPTLELENTGKSVIISNPNKDDISYELYLNGVQKKFNLGSALTDSGSYRLVCTDSVGNVTEYVFELNYLSAVTIALIAVVVAVVIGIIVAIIIFRFRRKIF